MRDLLQDRIPKNALRNKIVFIGSENSTSSMYLTPVGSLNRGEVFLQITDNLLEHRWIHRLGNLWYSLSLLFILSLSVFIMTYYPQSVAFVLTLFLATLITVLSAWVFDSFYFWIPVISPFVQLIATWIIFVGYQANKIERKNWLLQQEQKYLQELEQLKNNFVSLISHDLKTPIAKIQAIADRLLTQHPLHEFEKDLKSVRHSSEELNRYIQSILKVLRVESRDFKLHKEVGDINSLIQEAIDQLLPLAAEKQIQIATELEPMFSIEVDLTLIREVLVNLVENAIKYTPSGGQIRIVSREHENKVSVEVSDTGEGIGADEVAQVWRKFVRGKDQDMKSKGTGLGLYLVKYFIELHGGDVNLESEVKKGTKVSFVLPLEEESSSEGVSYAKI